jgi:hypothetical protein
MCNNNVITEVTHITFLGPIIDDTLSWNLHIDKVMKRFDYCTSMLHD